jgi:hypothetical protein
MLDSDEARIGTHVIELRIANNRGQNGTIARFDAFLKILNHLFLILQSFIGKNKGNRTNKPILF